MTPPTKLWIADAPHGTWSSGPVVVYDLPGLEQAGEWSTDSVLAKYRALGYAVTGPYVLQQEGR